MAAENSASGCVPVCLSFISSLLILFSFLLHLPLSIFSSFQLLSSFLSSLIRSCPFSSSLHMSSLSLSLFIYLPFLLFSVIFSPPCRTTGDSLPLAASPNCPLLSMAAPCFGSSPTLAHRHAADRSAACRAGVVTFISPTPPSFHAQWLHRCIAALFTKGIFHSSEKSSFFFFSQDVETRVSIAISHCFESIRDQDRARGGGQ